jgi:hypothetical protein
MSDAEFGSLKTERLALMRVHRELREIELAKARKQFVAIEDMEKAFGNKALAIKARLMGIPACLAAELVGQKSRVAI